MFEFFRFKLIRGFRLQHWSCSSFAHKLLAKYCVPKPSYATAEDWKIWNEQAKSKNRVIFWLVEEGFSYLQNIVYFPADLRLSIIRYIRLRYIVKSHIMQSNLQPGEYHEISELFLQCCFNQLEKFVEIELADGYVGLSCRRDPAKGVSVLEEDAVIMDGPLKSSSFGVSVPVYLLSDRAIVAREILTLYKWWKARAARPDPCETVGYNALLLTYEPHSTGHIWDILSGRDSEKTHELNKLRKVAHKIQQQYDKEDDEMLIRLIKIRENLST